MLTKPLAIFLVTVSTGVDGRYTASGGGEFLVELDNGNSYFRSKGLQCVVDIAVPGVETPYALKLTKGAGASWTLWHAELQQ
jgi:hypothetical protein